MDDLDLKRSYVGFFFPLVPGFRTPSMFVEKGLFLANFGFIKDEAMTIDKTS